MKIIVYWLAGFLALASLMANAQAPAPVLEAPAMAASAPLVVPASPTGSGATQPAPEVPSSAASSAPSAAAAAPSPAASASAPTAPTAAASAPAALPATAPIAPPPGATAVGQVRQANKNTPIKTEIVANKVVKGANGKEEFQAAANLQPGDLIQFSATFFNPNYYPIRFDPQIAIPKNTVYVNGSISPSTGKVVGTKGKQQAIWKIEQLESGAIANASMRVRYEGEGK